MYQSDAIHSRPSLAAKLARIYTFKGGATIDLTIRPAYYELLSRLKDPHLKLPPVIHVAGTNGKGSTIAYLKALLAAQNKRVHAYTSPHLITFNERIVLGGKPIDDTALEALLDEVLAAACDLPLTFFEVTTALAFVAFAREPADYLLLETGLGGRLDCTNVVPAPKACIITPISRDHCEFLGETLTEIAAEKAGIIKGGSCCVMAPQPDPVAKIIKNAAAAEFCAFYGFGETWRIAEKGGQVVFFWQGRDVVLNRPPLSGEHQIYNLGTALAALAVLDEAMLSDPAFLNWGLAQVSWPARLQQMDASICGLEKEKGWGLWIDGGHNQGAGEVLATQARAWQDADRSAANEQDDRKTRPFYLVLGMMRHKNPLEFITPLAPLADQIITVPIDKEPSAWPPEALAALLKRHGIASQSRPSLEAAFKALASAQPGRVLVAGSFYLAGKLLQQC